MTTRRFDLLEFLRNCLRRAKLGIDVATRIPNGEGNLSPRTLAASRYRSGEYASKLIEQGFTAKNFKGSILAWCEANQPLVTPQGVATNRVHTYSSKFKVSAMYKAVW